MNAELERLIGQYKDTESSMTERQKAEFEHKLWKDIVKGLPDERKGMHSQRDWCMARLGKGNFYEERSALLLAGAWAGPLFNMLQMMVETDRSDKAVKRAYSIIKNHRQRAVKKVKESGFKISYEEALRQILEAPKSTPAVDDAAFSMDIDDPQGRRTKQFIKRVSALTDEFIRTSVRGISNVEEMTVRVAKEDLMSFVREACDDFRRRVYVLRTASKKERERLIRVTRDDLREAAEVLGISIVWNKDVDLRFAKKVMLGRCAQLHPDKAGPMSDRQKAEYTAVIDSYKILERYMEGRKSHEDGERSHEGQ